MKALKKTAKKSFFGLTPAERENEVARFDHPIDLEKETRPLSPKERARFERAIADNPGISIYVRKDRRCDVVIHLDDDLLVQAKLFARKNKTTLPKMIDRGLRSLLSSEA